MWLQGCSDVNVHVLVWDNEGWDGYCDEREKGKSTEKLILEKQINLNAAVERARCASHPLFIGAWRHRGLHQRGEGRLVA